MSGILEGLELDESEETSEADVMEFLRNRAHKEQTDFVGKKNKKVSLMLAREHLFLEQFQSVASKIFKDKVVPSKYATKPHKGIKHRIANLLISDTHFHSMLDPREVPLQYGPLEEARRLSAIVVQAAEYKRQYREDTILFVHILGDIIQGQLHDMRDGAPLAEQFGAALYLLVQSISYLSAHFPQVVVRCTPGNHGRNTARHKERATNQKWDSIETQIYIALKIACASLPNVKIEVPYTPYYTFEAFGQRGFFTHGDTVINPGYPGRAINIAKVRAQINEINGKLETHQQYRLFAVGHVHVGSVTHLPNGAIFLSNGCLIPPDAYGLSIGSFDSACGQWIWESVDGHILGDHRFCVVDEHTDKDKSLDKVIKPFLGL